MKKEETLKIIEELENIKNKRSIRIDKLEIELEKLKEDQNQLVYTLMGLKSKVKNDEEEKWKKGVIEVVESIERIRNRNKIRIDELEIELSRLKDDQKVFNMQIEIFEDKCEEGE